MNFKYNCIILSKIDLGETERLYTLYTQEAGKIRSKAIGVKRPNAKLAGNLEPLTHAEIFMARGRGRGNITGAIAINNFLAIKSDLDATQKVFYVFGIVNRLINEEEKDQEVFNLLLGYLETMGKLASSSAENRKDIATLGFLFKFIYKLGYGIEVEKCVKCGDMLKPEKNYFSAEMGGTVCSRCEGKNLKKIKFNPDAIKLIRIFLKNKIDNFGKIKAGKEVINNLKMIIQEEIEWLS